ncbi:protein kinase [Streptomyces sp. NPDC012888]|uniref:serine/threonine-protein kinase n=1 Tax=Streptomyces sp. NPDC012888 TaxID=3364855 RepID=UPI0036AA51AC
MNRGELLSGRYELVQRLGRGGMGEVWAARDRSLRRDVAVKMLVLEQGALPELAQRFEREALAAARINHPNVAAVHDRGAHEDVLYLVMEKVDGRPLSEYVRSGQPMPLAEALTVAEGICTALVAAHRAGVVHYDIKPHNVMLTGEGEVKVVDFGIAGFLQTAFTAVARSSQLTPAGTAEYGAPEQFLSARGDERSDLYALGSVLFTLLTGRPPFTGHSPLAVIRLKLDDDAPRLDAVRPGLPPALSDLVATLLARDPALRPGTAREVRERIRVLRGASDRPDTTAVVTASALVATVTAPRSEAARRVLLARFARAARAVAARRGEDRVQRPAGAGRGAPGTSDEGWTFEVGWTGREPLESYAKGQGLLSTWLEGLILSAVSAGMFYVPFHAGLVDRGPSGRMDGAWSLLFVVAGLVGLAGALITVSAVVGTVRALRASALRTGASPWSLSVGPAGIVTVSAAGRCHFAWSDIQRIAIEQVRSTAPHRFTGLHLDLEPHAPVPSVLRPAGWPYVRPPEGRSRLAVCVLGPLTERQRVQLVDALVKQGGSRWVPSLVFTTPPAHP